MTTTTQNQKSDTPSDSNDDKFIRYGDSMATSKRKMMAVQHPAKRPHYRQNRRW